VKKRFFILLLALLLLPAGMALAQDKPAAPFSGGGDGGLNRLFFSIVPKLLEDGFMTDLSLGYNYNDSWTSELRFRFTKESYNESMYDLEESLLANDEQTFELFLLPFRYNFFSGSILSLNAAAGVYYEYNTLEQHGYFNMPALGPESLNIYRNDFSMHIFGPLVEAGLRFRKEPVEIRLDAGIAPIFYLRRDQSMQMKPYMGAEFFDYSQDTGGSPYFYGKLDGVVFRFLSLSLMYEFARIDYDAIAYDSGRNWVILKEELLSHSFKLEASILISVGGGFSIKAGYGHSFDTIELASSTPVHDDKHYFIIGTEKMTF
jgi:hypothetical protein